MTMELLEERLTSAYLVIKESKYLTFQKNYNLCVTKVINLVET